MDAVGNDGGPTGGLGQLRGGPAGGGVVDRIGRKASFRRQKHLPQAGGIGAEARAEHGVQHPGMGVAFDGIQNGRIGEGGLQLLRPPGNTRAVIEVKAVVLPRKCGQELLGDGHSPFLRLSL